MDFPLQIHFSNHLDGNENIIARFDAATITPRLTKQIVTICNQALVYDTLFRAPFQGQVYSEQHATGFIEAALTGWREATHFIFLVLNSESDLLGCIDVKSPNLNNAEIGYWADEAQPGNMTNTVRALSAVCFKLGFKRLTAYVKLDNQKSSAVLTRAGFAPDTKLVARSGFNAYSLASS